MDMGWAHVIAGGFARSPGCAGSAPRMPRAIVKVDPAGESLPSGPTLGARPSHRRGAASTTEPLRPGTPTFDEAWRVEETNRFGTGGFIAFRRAWMAEAYLGGNAGSGTPEEWGDRMEDSNLRAEKWARLRAAGGAIDAIDVDLCSDPQRQCNRLVPRFRRMAISREPEALPALTEELLRS